MTWLQLFFTPKTVAIPVSKVQKELLEIFIGYKAEFEEWATQQPQPRIRFQFFYPSAVHFFYGEFKLFTAFFKRSRQGQLGLMELKMTETNFDIIRCTSWKPFEELILLFLNTLEESKKVALFEQRKILYEYESLCSKKAEMDTDISSYPGLAPSLAGR